MKILKKGWEFLNTKKGKYIQIGLCVGLIITSSMLIPFNPVISSLTVLICGVSIYFNWKTARNM